VTTCNPLTSRVGHQTLYIKGSGGQLQPAKEPEIPFFLGNAGTASRFLTTMCTLVTPPAGTRASSLSSLYPRGSVRS
jgi:pentafunctional AROM polypeptide